MAVGFPTKVNYATGDVLSATNMNDLSGTVNTLDGTQYSGGKNRALNSAFQVWQRGTSISLAASSGVAYTADRWCTATGVNQASTISRQVTGDTTNLPNVQYCLRFQRNSGQTGTGVLNLIQSMESINSIPLAGKTITLSFYARAGANFSSASNLLTSVVATGTGTNQNLFSGYTGQVDAILQTSTLTTTWQRFTYSGTVASTATEITLQFNYTPVGTASTNDYFEVTGVQLEASTVASAFATNGDTYQAELAACQRYYYRNTPGSSGRTFGLGQNYLTTNGVAFIQYPVTMRTRPTALEQSGTASNYGAWRANATVEPLTSVPAYDANTTDSIGAVVYTTAAVLVAGYAAAFTANNAAAYLGWSAEL